jgi:hypothetical protein
MSRRRSSLVAPLATAVACAAFAGPAIARPADAGPAGVPSTMRSPLRAPAAPSGLAEEREAHLRIAGRLATPPREAPAAGSPGRSSTPSDVIIVGGALAALVALVAGGVAAARRTRVPHTTSAA